MSIDSYKDKPENVFKSAQQQEMELQQQIFEFKASKFEIVPDGKLPWYDAAGICCGFMDAPF